HPHDLLQDQRQAEGGNDRQGGDTPNGLNDRNLDQGAEDQTDQRNEDEADPEVSRRLKRGPGQHGADHEEIAVGDVDDVEQAENDRKTERDERDDQAPDQAVQ